MDVSLIAEVVVWKDSADDPEEQKDRIVSINTDALVDTGNVEIAIHFDKHRVYLRMPPERLAAAIAEVLANTVKKALA